jgi:hypothetical protein
VSKFSNRTNSYLVRLLLFKLAVPLRGGTDTRDAVSQLEGYFAFPLPDADLVRYGGNSRGLSQWSEVFYDSSSHG